MVKITPILRDLLRNQWLNKKFISPLTNKHLYLLSYIESASLRQNCQNIINVIIRMKFAGKHFLF